MGTVKKVWRPTKTDLTQEQVRRIFIYEPDTGVFRYRNSRKKPVTEEAGYVMNCGYRQVKIKRKLYLAHRVAWLYIHNEHPPEIDHLNGIRDDNRIANLRAVSRCVNRQNSGLYKNNTSGYSGVTFHKACGKWLARIAAFKKVYRLGLFVNIEDAIAARLEAQERLNFGPNCGAKQDETY